MRPWYRRYLPGWIVTGGGGSGGAATVQTDGVTLTGDGSSGNKIRILQVETQPRLTGAGTVASKLDVTGWPLTYATINKTGGGTISIPVNQTVLVGFVLPYALTFSQIQINVGTADATHNADLGIYNLAGTLIADIGPQIVSGGNPIIAFQQGSQTISPGLYLFGATITTGGSMAVGGTTVTYCWFSSTTGGVTAGGQLAASVAGVSVTGGFATEPFSALF